MGYSNDKILEFNSSRAPAIIALKYGYMQENLFRFFRGTCHLFYDDLSQAEGFPGGPVAWISGDAHLENFGSFRAANDQVYFDLNDFDEAILAPVSWELVRLVCSVFVGFESLGIDGEKADKMAQLLIRSYASTLAGGKAEYVEQATVQGIISDFLGRVSRRKQKAILQKRTTYGQKRVQMLLDNPKHLKLDKRFKQELCAHVESWLKVDEDSPYNYRVLDSVFRLAGTGSVGLERYAFVLESVNKVGPRYMLLDMKEAAPSAAGRFVTTPQPVWASEALRVVTLQKRMQNRYPALLSYSDFREKSFIMQEMQPTKDNINFGLLEDRYRDMYSVIDSMATLTASSHIRSTGQDGSCSTDELKAWGQRTDWQEPLITYARQYCEKMKSYYKEFLSGFQDKAVKRIPKRFSVANS